MVVTSPARPSSIKFARGQAIYETDARGSTAIVLKGTSLVMSMPIAARRPSASRRSAARRC